MSELKACSVCESSGIGNKIICCSNGNCINYFAGMKKEDWNRRPIEDALSKRVEELERTVDDLRGELAQSDRASDVTRIAELEAERDKLREALERIANDPDRYASIDAFIKGKPPVNEALKKIAREALKGGE